MINKFQKEPLISVTPGGKFQRAFRHGDLLWQILITAMAALILFLIGSIGWSLWQNSLEAQVHFGWSFILPSSIVAWNPVSSEFRSWAFIYSTLMTSIVAILVALPLGLGVAVFLAELCPAWLRPPLGLTVELLAAIPSVVFGLWGIFVFLPEVVAPVGHFLNSSLGQIPGLQIFFGGSISPGGASRLAAGLVLAIMILPTIASVTRDIFLAVPRSQREASFALGANRWETIYKVLIPNSISGILGAVILGLGRAIGETMAVTMVIGNSIEGSLSLLRPGYTLSSVIANEFAEAVTTLHSQALIEVALVLFVMTLVLNLGARLLIWRASGRTLRGVRA